MDDPLSAMVAFWMFFILCTQQVLAPAPAKDGFTQELVTKVGTQLAGSISDRYLAVSPQHELVVLEDVHGWVPTWRDVVNAKGCLVPILQHEATRVPGLMFIMMVILVADSVLNSKVVKGSETEAYKYPRTRHPLCGFPRAPSLASRELSNKAF